MTDSAAGSDAQANADLHELRDLAAAQFFDLFVFLRELEKLGLPSLEIDVIATERAGDGVERYQLPKWQLVLLATLRAMDRDADKG